MTQHINKALLILRELGHTPDCVETMCVEITTERALVCVHDAQVYMASSKMMDENDSSL